MVHFMAVRSDISVTILSRCQFVTLCVVRFAYSISMQKHQYIV